MTRESDIQASNASVTKLSARRGNAIFLSPGRAKEHYVASHPLACPRKAGNINKKHNREQQSELVSVVAMAALRHLKVIFRNSRMHPQLCFPRLSKRGSNTRATRSQMQAWAECPVVEVPGSSLKRGFHNGTLGFLWFRAVSQLSNILFWGNVHCNPCRYPTPLGSNSEQGNQQTLRKQPSCLGTEDKIHCRGNTRSPTPAS